MNFKKIFSSILFFASILLFTQSYATGVGTVTGSVTSSTGSVANASVRLFSAMASSFEAVATTGQNGEFILTDVPIGDFEVVVQNASGSLKRVSNGSFPAGQASVQVNITLE